MAWGGAEEQKKEHEAGNLNAKDWHDEARQILEATLEDYWMNNNMAANDDKALGAVDVHSKPSANHPLESDYDRHRRSLIQHTAMRADSGGWKEELHRYLNDLPSDVSKNTDVISWWAVCIPIIPFSVCSPGITLGALK